MSFTKKFTAPYHWQWVLPDCTQYCRLSRRWWSGKTRTPHATLRTITSGAGGGISSCTVVVLLFGGLHWLCRIVVEYLHHRGCVLISHHHHLRPALFPCPKGRVGGCRIHRHCRGYHYRGIYNKAHAVTRTVDSLNKKSKRYLKRIYF